MTRRARPKPRPKPSRSGDPEVERILDDFAREEHDRANPPDPADDPEPSLWPDTALIDAGDEALLELFGDYHDGG